MRGFLVSVLAMLAILLLPLADLGLWVQRQLLDTSQFTQLADEVLDEPDVRAALADQVAQRLEDRNPDLAQFDSQIRQGVDQVAQEGAFRVIFSDAVGRMHEQLTDRDDQLTIDLDGMVPLVRERLPSDVAARIPSETGLGTFTVLRRDDIPVLWRAVAIAQRAAVLFPIAALILIAAAIGLARRRGVAAAVIGVASAGMLLLVVTLVQFGRSLLENIGGDAVQERAFDAGAGVVFGSLVQQTLLLAGVMLGVAGAGIVAVVVARGRERSEDWA